LWFGKKREESSATDSVTDLTDVSQKETGRGKKEEGKRKKEEKVIFKSDLDFSTNCELRTANS
jgi:hypothetical protein